MRSCAMACGVGLLPAVMNMAETGEANLAVKIAGPERLIVDQYPLLELVIRNEGDEPVTLVKVLDGSVAGWRYPLVSISVTDAKGQTPEFQMGGRCGNMNRIERSDIAGLAPGEEIRSRLSWPFGGHGFIAPGDYELTVVYDLKAPELAAWIPEGRFFILADPDPEIIRLLAQVPPARVESPPFPITVHDLTEELIEEMVIGYFRGRQREFVSADHALGRWSAGGIRRASGHATFRLAFAPDYKPPPPPPFMNEENWFPEGVYLLRPSYSRNSSTVHPWNDPEAQGYFLHFPAQVDRSTRHLGDQIRELLGIAEGEQ